MVQTDPVSPVEAQAVLEYLATQRRRLHIFSELMSANHVTKVRPLPHDPTLTIYHVNTVDDELALVSDVPRMLWLNRSARSHRTIYEDPHVSRWYFQTLAPRHLSLVEMALVLSLAIAPRPVTSRLISRGDEIPHFQHTSTNAHWPASFFAEEAARRHHVTTHIHPPQRRGRIITFWIWQQERGIVLRFRVLINIPFGRLIIAQHEIDGGIGDYYRL